MKLQVLETKQYHDHESDSFLMSIHYQIMDDEGAQLMERVQSYPLDTSAEEIQADLARALQVYEEAVERHEGAKELQAGLDNVTQVGEALNGLEIQ